MEDDDENNPLSPPTIPQILTVQIPTYKTKINGRLPPDSLVQIWARLPIKSVYKFRSVCKLWNHKIITDPLLSSLIHTLGSPSAPPSLLLTLTHTQTEPVKHPDRPVHISSKPLIRTLSRSLDPHLYPIKNGFSPYVDHTLSLLPSSPVGPIVCFLSNAFFYLSNPSTQEFLKLPRGQNGHNPDSKFSAFGYLISENRYVLARKNHGTDILELLEFGPGQAQIAQWKPSFSCCPGELSARDFGIMVNHTFYWRVSSDEDKKAFVWAVDVKGRRRRAIGKPEGNDDEVILHDLIYIVEHKGSVCAVDNFSKPPRTMIWVLGEEDEWVRKYNIYISGMDRDVVYPFWDYGGESSGEMVLCNGTRSRLYICCFKNKSVKQVYRPKQRTSDRLAVYTPGLFPLSIAQ